jgi:uncharacterized protein (DUF1810 family)
VDDPYRLQRFVDAQASTYDHALAEIRNGHKRGHWMWFVFPQITGLGVSATAREYAISGLDEARAYLDHPVLGPRLRECAAAVAALAEDGVTDAGAVCGGVDAMKLRSSVTLFARADPDEPAFGRVLDRFYDGEPDPATSARL